ncbi:hypothetical protein I79_024052 [Cricetulus griseus]|uniref:Uncharacterized protein n=1 Tax=Cricetulus griseus TaxID=10029 RepID=G3IJL6_CRIGR|nr:hypothetical protein I79_024052 [Cricetulus griseus]
MAYWSRPALGMFMIISFPRSSCFGKGTAIGSSGAALRRLRCVYRSHCEPPQGEESQIQTRFHSCENYPCPYNQAMNSMASSSTQPVRTFSLRLSCV